MVASAEAETRAAELPKISASDRGSVARVRAWLGNSDYAASATKALMLGTADGEPQSDIARTNPVVKLFLGGETVATEFRDDFLDCGTIDALSRVGLVREEAGRLHPLVRIAPFNGLFIVSDREWVADSCAKPDYVRGLTGDTAWLANLSVRAEVDRTLDLCTGTGVLALLAARHSRRVVATDVNPRALAFAKLNSILNGIDNIEILEGDRFEPVAGERFDLISCKAPSAPAPIGSCIDSDGVRNESVESLVKTVPSYLEVGGYAQILCSSLRSAEDQWTRLVARWLKDSGCNAWVACGRSGPAGERAEQSPSGCDAADGKRLGGDEFGQDRERRTVSVDTGLITMRRSERSRNWVRVDSNLPQAFADAGAYVARCFWLQDFLDSVPGFELLNEIVYLSPSVELEQTSVPSSAGWKLKRCELRMTR
ncbi:MAG TPA: methyltransferase [Gammaproteobacteria bacterium]